MTDRPTDYATQSVTIGRMYIRSTAMRPNNTQNGINSKVKEMAYKAN